MHHAAAPCICTCPMQPHFPHAAVPCSCTTQLHVPHAAVPCGPAPLWDRNSSCTRQMQSEQRISYWILCMREWGFKRASLNSIGDIPFSNAEKTKNDLFISSFIPWLACVHGGQRCMAALHP